MAASSKFGPLGSVWLFGGVIAAIWLLFLSLCRVVLGPTRRPMEVALLMLAAFTVASPDWGPRLQLFTVLWGLAVVRIAYGYLVNGERRLIWLLPVVVLLWANTHMGSVLLAFLLIAGLIAGDVFERRRLPDRTVFVVLLLSLIAPVLNPYGAAAYVFPVPDGLLSGSSEPYPRMELAQLPGSHRPRSPTVHRRPTGAPWPLAPDVWMLAALSSRPACYS